jgi:hypothetical protein
MPSRIETYRERLRLTNDVGDFLRAHSGLPGPRGNLELAHAFAQEGSARQIRALAALDPNEAPENTPDGFLAFCGVLGLGRLVLEGDAQAEAALLRRASDPRWRVREAVATALQLVGDADRRRYAKIVAALARGGPLEQRAAVAAIAEPRLLTGSVAVRSGLRVLERATRFVARAAKPLGEREKVLRQALGYAWSVVVAAEPAQGKPVMEVWLRSKDPDIAWLMAQNLGKARLQRAAPGWSATWRRRLAARGPTAAKAGRGR